MPRLDRGIQVEAKILNNLDPAVEPRGDSVVGGVTGK